jgi:5'-AMP-activated protein kinase catalytic alpha subunit
MIENKKNYYIIMEYLPGGELFNYIVKKKRLEDDEACYFFTQIINGLEFIHRHNIVHRYILFKIRDLKPENLLITNDRILKIIDFGLSNSYRTGQLLQTPCGSPCYASPEMILGKKYSGLLIDIWSCGIILYAMVCGYLPFEVRF